MYTILTIVFQNRSIQMKFTISTAEGLNSTQKVTIFEQPNLACLLDVILWVNESFQQFC